MDMNMAAKAENKVEKQSHQGSDNSRQKSSENELKAGEESEQTFMSEDVKRLKVENQSNKGKGYEQEPAEGGEEEGRLRTQDQKLRNEDEETHIEIERSRLKPTEILARDALLMTLPQYHPETKIANENEPVTNHEELNGPHPTRFEEWTDFETRMDDLIERVSRPDALLKITRNKDILRPGNIIMDHPFFATSFITGILRHLFSILSESGLLDDDAKFNIGPNRYQGLEGGFPNVSVMYKHQYAFVLQNDCPSVFYKTQPHPSLDMDDGNRFRGAIHTTYSYMITKENVGFGAVTNYDKWVFLKRIQQSQQDGTDLEILQMSSVYEKDRARLALAAFTLASIEAHGAQQGPLSSLRPFTGPLGVNHTDSTSDQQQQHQGRANRLLSQAAAALKNFFKVGTTVVAGQRFTTTKQALDGVESLSVHARDRSTRLKQSEAGCVFRYRHGNRDLVWRQLDVKGLPRTCRDYSTENLKDNITSEIEAYMHLKEYWGLLVPHFVYFGMDFDMLWVFVTSYEGVDLHTLVQLDGGLTLEIKSKAKESLMQLHSKQVFHGRAIELQHALWREHDRRILWIGLEFSIIGGHEIAQAQKRELREFQEILDKVPTLPESTTKMTTSTSSLTS